MRLDDYIAQVREYLEENQVELPRHTGELREGGDWEVLSGTLSLPGLLKAGQRHGPAPAGAPAGAPLRHAVLLRRGRGLLPGPLPLYVEEFDAEPSPRFHLRLQPGRGPRPHGGQLRPLGEMSQDMLVRGMRTMAEHMPAPGDAPYRVLVVNPPSWNAAGRVRVSGPAGERQHPGLCLGGRQGAASGICRQVLPARAPGRVQPHQPSRRAGRDPVRAGNLRGPHGPFSARNYFVKKRDSFSPLAQPGQPGCELENEFFTAQVAEDGKVTVTDKRTGKCWEDLLELEDTADQGDSYVYVPGNGCAVYGSQFPAEVTPGGPGPSGRAAASPAPCCCPPTTILTPRPQRSDGALQSHPGAGPGAGRAPPGGKLHPGQPGQGPPPPPAGAHWRAGAGEHGGHPPSTWWPTSQRPLPCGPERHPANATFALVKDGDGGVAVLTEGSYEYEHIDEAGTLAFTLVRATGVISREADHRFTNGDTWLCPGNQCLRVLEGRLGVAPLPSRGGGHRRPAGPGLPRPTAGLCRRLRLPEILRRPPRGTGRRTERAVLPGGPVSRPPGARGRLPAPGNRQGPGRHRGKAGRGWQRPHPPGGELVPPRGWRVRSAAQGRCPSPP